jgi:hypothetical protein
MPSWQMPSRQVNEHLPSSTIVMHYIDKITLFLRPRRKTRLKYTDSAAPNTQRMVDLLVLDIVTPFLEPSALAKLCLTSSHFLEFFRPILYRHLTLWMHSYPTLDLLCSRSTLAQNVISLTIRAHFPRWHNCRPNESFSIHRWIFGRMFPEAHQLLTKAVSKMTSLQTICMNNFAFIDVAEERTFVQMLRDCNIPVRNFSLRAKSNFNYVWLSANGLIFTNLTTLIWDLRGIYNKGDSKSPSYSKCNRCAEYKFQKHLVSLTPYYLLSRPQGIPSNKFKFSLICTTTGTRDYGRCNFRYYTHSGSALHGILNGETSKIC